MDWALHHQGDNHGREPRIKLLKVYWRMIGPSKKPSTCGLYRTDAGLEIRAERNAEDLIRSERVKTEVAADTYAAARRATLDAQGGFTPLDVSEGGGGT